MKSKPTSAEIVVSAIPALLMFIKKNKLISGTDIFFIIFIIKTSMFKFSHIFWMNLKTNVDWEI